ncbi:MAG TPA: nuclear transport factor 2 family protein [Arenimonas sp.]|jgi:uncharacterized protein (TIGR02246 family)|nr:nuclear transport factor 2 family protein [Arenimonas sp.]
MMTRHRTRFGLAVFAALLLAACATTRPAPAPQVDVATLEREVAATETAFARTMADRDFEAFASFLAEDAIFVNGQDPLRGREAITAHWKRFFEKPEAPFSWRPDIVVVLSSGELAQTKGPVFDPEGNPIAEFRSTWRRNADGSWQIVFDDGACLCGAQPQ